MENLTKIIGENLKNIRGERGLSLDKVAEATGVSKAMLGQIERGESNPTVAILWKIASGLKVSLTSFLERPQATGDFFKTRLAEITPIIENDGLMIIYPLFIFDNSKGFEIFSVQLKAGCNHISEPHSAGVEEYILVTEGSMSVVVGEEVHHLTKGDALRFLANQKHTYLNKTTQEAWFQNIIFYS